MLQFNLLPDVKIAYVKAQRTKRLVISSSLIAMAVAVGITSLLALLVYGVQKHSMNDLNSDIKDYSSELKGKPDLNKILTVQNQLASLDSLHEKKIIASRVFQLAQLTTPSGVTISDYTTDFTAQTISITGAASSLDRVNVMADTLKFVTITTNSDGAPMKPFSSVVLSQFSRSDAGATYTVTLSYDPVIFQTGSNFTLTVPKQVTSSSVTEQPVEIFKKVTPASGGSE
jgi:hypothetical protein